MAQNKLDFATMHTAAGFPKIAEAGTAFKFNNAEELRLRSLALQVAEISESPAEQVKSKLWLAHNDLKPKRPMVFADPENGWNEIISASELVTEDPLARIWEMFFLKQIYWALNMKDDRVIERYFDVPWVYNDDGWGVELMKHGGDSGGAYIVEPAIWDYDNDLQKVHFPKIIIDYEKSAILLELAERLFGDILEVRQSPGIMSIFAGWII